MRHFKYEHGRAADFQRRKKLVGAEEAIYLGNTLNKRANAAAEVDKQIQQVRITMWKPHQYWKASEASKK